MIQQKETIKIVGVARTNGEIGRTLEKLLEVGIFGKISYLETTTIYQESRIVKLEVEAEDLTDEKIDKIIRFMKNRI